MKDSVKMKSREVAEMFEEFSDRLGQWGIASGLEKEEVFSLVLTTTTLFLGRMLTINTKGELLEELLEEVKAVLTRTATLAKTIESLKEEHGVQ